MKKYSELLTIADYYERFRYLKVGGTIGIETFGSDRYLNQILYNSPEWRKFARDIRIRDNGFDMAFRGYEIPGKIIVHHINPITVDDVIERRPCIFDPENVVCVSHMTHEAIHYGDVSLLPKDPVERRPNDTIPWRR